MSHKVFTAKVRFFFVLPHALYALAGIQLPRLSHMQAGNSAVGACSAFRWTFFDKIFPELLVTSTVNNVPTLIKREGLTPYLQMPIT
jgi:hypothetical protein